MNAHESAPAVTEDVEYAPEYSREERIKYRLIAVAVAATIMLVCNFFLFPKLLMVDHGECQTVYGVPGVALVMWMLFVGLPATCVIVVGLFVIPRAVAAIRARQYPAPGRKVIHKVRILRGRAAVLRSCLELALIVVIVAIIVWGGFEAAAISRLAAHAKLDCVRMPEHPARPPPPRHP